MQQSISSVSPTAGALAAVWSSGERTDLPYLWLRDNCGCSECRVVQTTEKRFHIFEVARDLRPLQVGIERAESGEEAIAIAWPDGHRTRYRSSEIHGLLSQPRSELRYWDGQFQPRQFDYAGFLASDQTAKYQAVRSSPVSSRSMSITSAFMELGMTQNEPARKPVTAVIGSIQ